MGWSLRTHNFYNFVYKLDKTLYRLKQAPRAWYDRLSTFLLTHGYTRGKIDNTLFHGKEGEDLFIVQVYVDDIIFGGTNDSLGVEQTLAGTSIHQQKYIK